MIIFFFLIRIYFNLVTVTIATVPYVNNLYRQCEQLHNANEIKCKKNSSLL